MKTLSRWFTTIYLLGVALSGCGGGGSGDGGNENQPSASNKTWGTAEPIETDNGNNWDPAIAMDANGNAIVAWTQGDSTPPNILASRYAAVARW